MTTYKFFNAVQYAYTFIKQHFWELLQIVLVFMGLTIVCGIASGVSLKLLEALSQNIWLSIAIGSPFLVVFLVALYGLWNVSFITYLLSLARTQQASMKEHLKKGFTLRLLKILLVDMLFVLFLASIAFLFSLVVLGVWWYSGMQLALWLRIVLGIIGMFLTTLLIGIGIRLFFAKMIIVDTDSDIFAAFSVSWQATKNNFWRIFVVALGLLGVSALISTGAQQITALLQALAGDTSLIIIVGVCMQVLAAIVNMVVLPIIVMYYYLELNVARNLIAGR